jgi:hypothetical protein
VLTEAGAVVPIPMLAGVVIGIGPEFEEFGLVHRHSFFSCPH